MKAIILAAGMGTRLGYLTRDKPKCLVPLAGKSLLGHQLEVLRTITDDIVVVRGYMAKAIACSGVRYIENHEYSTTNMVGSLMAAREEFNGDCLVCYADIVYEPRILHEVQHARCSIGVVVDTDFQEYWKSRLGDWLNDSESLQLNQGMIAELGRPSPKQEDVHARYLGLLKFDNAGTNAFKRTYDHHANFAKDGPWYNSKSIRQAYMTDMIQAIIDDGHAVHAIQIKRGWLELDTERDFELYHQWIRAGSMRRFCKLQWS